MIDQLAAVRKAIVATFGAALTTWLAANADQRVSGEEWAAIAGAAVVGIVTWWVRNKRAAEPAPVTDPMAPPHL